MRVPQNSRPRKYGKIQHRVVDLHYEHREGFGPHPMPTGHEISWECVTRNTSMQGMSYEDCLRRLQGALKD